MGCWGLFADASVEQRTKKLKDTFALWKKQNNLMRHTFGDFSYYKKTYEENTQQLNLNHQKLYYYITTTNKLHLKKHLANLTAKKKIPPAK